MGLIGSRLRDLRGDRTLAEFADTVGVSRSAWSNYEAGRRLPSHEMIKRVATRVGVSPDSILPGGELTRSVTPTPSDNWPANIPALWLYNRLLPAMDNLGERQRLLWWAANLPSLVDDLADKIHDYAVVRDIDTIEAAFAVRDDLRERSEKELFKYVSGIVELPEAK